MPLMMMSPYEGLFFAHDHLVLLKKIIRNFGAISSGKHQITLLSSLHTNLIKQFKNK